MSSEWDWIRLGDFCEKIGSGATPKGGKDTYMEAGPYRLIRSQNIYNDGFSPSGLVFISDEQAQKLDGVAVQKNDVLLNITGESVARVCLALAQYLPARVNQHVAIIRPFSNTLDSRFLRYFLASPYQQDLMLGLAGGGATRSALTKGMIENFKIPCPPLSTQSAISEMLSALDDRIFLLRETNATLEVMAEALFKSWFVDFDPVRAKAAGFEPEGMDATTAAFFPDRLEESKLGFVPCGWLIGELRDLLILQRGFDLPANDRVAGDYPLIAASGPSGTHRIAMAKGPGVVTGRSGVLGKVFLTLEDYWPLNTTLWVKEFKHATPCYAYELLRLLDLSLFNAGSAVPTLNRNHIHGLRYVLPPLELVHAYEDVARAFHLRILENCRHAQTLAQLRDTLLPRLISGQLRLPVAQELVEEVCA